MNEPDQGAIHLGLGKAIDGDAHLGDPDTTEWNPVPETFTYALLDNAGGRFTLDNDKIVVADGERIEPDTEYDLLVRSFDKGGFGIQRSLEITVGGSNNPPVANPDVAMIGTDGWQEFRFEWEVDHNDWEEYVVRWQDYINEWKEPIDVLANDEDADGDDDSATLKVVSASSASGAEVSYSGAPGAGITYDLSAAVFADDPSRIGPQTDLITYTIEDKHGAQATSSVDVTLGLTIEGTEQRDVLEGGLLGNLLIGHGGDDILDGGPGNDAYWFDLGDGVDEIYEAGGTDAIYFGDQLNPINVSLNSDGYGLSINVGDNGDAVVIPSQFSYEPWARIEHLLFTDGKMWTLPAEIGMDGTPSADLLIGGGGFDFFNGGDGDDWLSGGYGDDFLFGDAGDDLLNAGASDDFSDDWLDGGAGADTMVGGPGNDQFTVDDIGDVVIEMPGLEEGRDVVMSFISYDLAPNVEDLQLWGSSGDIDGSGNDEDNLIGGNASNNRLSGLGGDDWLSGGYGDDSLSGGFGSDTFIFAPGSGEDRIEDFDVGDLIDVSRYGFESLDVVTNNLQDVSEGTLIDLGDENSILVVGVASEALNHPEYFVI